MIKIKEIKIPKDYKYISAFLTMRCNLNCSFCLNAFDKNFNKKKFDEISGTEWVNALNKIESRHEVPVTLSGGEPFLHKDFIYIIKNLKPDLGIDILTNLQWGKKGLEKFINEIEPNRLKRDAPYASIRVSYHPEQIDILKLVKDVKKLHDSGFSIGIWSVLYPSPEQLSRINQAQFICKDYGIEFRVKEYTGIYKEELYGDHSKYSKSVFQQKTKNCLCKPSELLICTNGNVYRCHRDLYAKENLVGNIIDENFEIEDIFRPCDKYGNCHPCDVKLKTNYKQKLSHTSVEIKDIN